MSDRPNTMSDRPDPDAALNPRQLARFWAKVARGGDDDCWRWTGAVDRRGRGLVRVAGRVVTAHRVCWRLHGRDLPDRWSLRHTCEGGRCVNPRHLTPVHKATDRRQRPGPRRPPAPGTVARKAKLTAEQVAEARRRYAAGGVTQRALAREMGVCETTVTGLLSRRTWAHVP